MNIQFSSAKKRNKINRHPCPDYELGLSVAESSTKALGLPALRLGWHVCNIRAPIANFGLWDYRGKIWDYGIAPCLKLGLQKSCLNLLLWDYTTEIMSEFVIMGLNYEPIWD